MLEVCAVMVVLGGVTIGACVALCWLLTKGASNE